MAQRTGVALFVGRVAVAALAAAVVIGVDRGKPYHILRLRRPRRVLHVGPLHTHVSRIFARVHAWVERAVAKVVRSGVTDRERFAASLDESDVDVFGVEAVSEVVVEKILPLEVLRGTVRVAGPPARVQGAALRMCVRVCVCVWNTEGGCRMGW